MDTPLNNEQYAAMCGLRCPFCGGIHMTTGTIHYDETQAWLPCKCNDCFREWNDIYQLTGYEEETS